MSKLNKAAMARRDRVETVLVRSTAARRRISLAVLRNRQAIERQPSLTDLLFPAIDDLAAARSEIMAMQDALEEIWQEGERVRWKVVDD